MLIPYLVTDGALRRSMLSIAGKPAGTGCCSPDLQAMTPPGWLHQAQLRPTNILPVTVRPLDDGGVGLILYSYIQNDHYQNAGQFLPENTQSLSDLCFHCFDGNTQFLRNRCIFHFIEPALVKNNPALGRQALQCSCDLLQLFLAQQPVAELRLLVLRQLLQLVFFSYRLIPFLYLNNNDIPMCRASFERIAVHRSADVFPRV